MNGNMLEQKEQCDRKGDGLILTKRLIGAIRRRKTWFINKLPKEEEKEYANEILERYLKMFKVMTVSEFELMKEIVYQEVLKFRLRILMDTVIDGHVYHFHVKTLHILEDKILTYQKKLGIGI